MSNITDHTGYRTRHSDTLPATCNPGDLYTDDSGGATGLYVCVVANTWIGPFSTTVGTVTSVTGTAPIAVATGTTTPVVSLNDTAVTPGAYTSANITIDQKGRITLAASGGTAPGGISGDLQTNNGAGAFGAITPASGVSTFLATPSSANLRATLTDELGTGAALFDGATPTGFVLTNATGLPVSTGISGLGTAVAAFLATPSSANFAAAVTGETGTGNVVFSTNPALTTPDLGTPSAATLTNATGLPVSTGISGLAAGIAAFLATPSSANLITAVTNETGSGALVFGTSPTLVTPTLGAATATSINGNTFTTGTYTLTGTAAKTLNFTNTLTLSGTDSTTMTFPTTSATIARTDAGQTFTGQNTFTSPKILTDISDTNGNELFKFTATGSAVNEFTVANAATGGRPTLSGSGETNVGITVFSKGSGTVRIGDDGGSTLLEINRAAGRVEAPGYYTRPADGFSLIDNGGLQIGGTLSSQIKFTNDTTWYGTVDATLTREASGVIQAGTTTRNNSGVFDAAGYRISNAATSGNYLRGNGTNFVSAALSAADLTGTTTNDNAAAGKIGEYTTATIAVGSAVSLTNATATNVTSVSLTAGDWQVWGVVDYVTTGATTTDFKSGVNSTSATFGGQDTFQNMPFIATALSDTFGHAVAPTRFSLSGTTTVYLLAQSNFSVGTATAYGSIFARRMR